MHKIRTQMSAYTLNTRSSLQTNYISRQPDSHLQKKFRLQSAFRLVGWHFLPDKDKKMAETISIVPISLSIRDLSQTVYFVNLYFWGVTGGHHYNCCHDRLSSNVSLSVCHFTYFIHNIQHIQTISAITATLQLGTTVTGEGVTVGKMRNCGMRNAESKMRNPKMRKCLRNGA